MARIDYYYRSISTSTHLNLTNCANREGNGRPCRIPLSIQRVKSFESFATVSAGILILIIAISVGMIVGGGSASVCAAAAAAAVVDAVGHVVIVDVASIVVIVAAVVQRYRSSLILHAATLQAHN